MSNELSKCLADFAEMVYNESNLQEVCHMTTKEFQERSPLRIFLHYFKNSLLALIENDGEILKMCPERLPKDFFTNHVCSVFVETVKWWLSRGKNVSAEEINDYFLLAAGLK